MNDLNIYEISHELKNPLSIINGYIDIMSTSNKDDVEKYLSIIKNEVNRGISILNNILAYNKVNKDYFHITNLFNDIKMITPSLIKNKNIRIVFKIKKDLVIYSDYNKLKEVLVNIIKNSIESISYFGNIYIFSYELKSHYIISVKDNGKGMNKHILNCINNNISITTKSNGNGIGVMHSKEVISKLNGTIKYYSTINKGTFVKIILPK